MKLLLKRTENSASSPNPDPAQVDVGELVMNSITGKLFTKLTDGTLVEFVPQAVCFGPTPTIIFPNVTEFCCYGDVMNIVVKDLLPEPKTYTFTFDELTGNGSSGTISTAAFTNYTVSGTAGIPSGQSVALREATIPVNLTINDADSINIFKFTVSSDNNTLTEKTLAIPCNVCS